MNKGIVAMILTVFLLSNSCKKKSEKDTIIEGFVYDSFTKMPIENASVSISILTPHEACGRASGNHLVHTDSVGRYQIVFSEDYDIYDPIIVEKNGYFKEYSAYENHETNEIDFYLSQRCLTNFELINNNLHPFIYLSFDPFPCWITWFTPDHNDYVFFKDSLKVSTKYNLKGNQTIKIIYFYKDSLEDPVKHNLTDTTLFLLPNDTLNIFKKY